MAPLTSKDDTDDMAEVYSSLLRWCDTNQQMECVWRRLRFGNWKHWMDPWVDAIAANLQDQNGFDATWHTQSRPRARDNGSSLNGYNPVTAYGFSSVESQGGLYLTSDSRGISMEGNPLHSIEGNRVVDFSRFLVGALLPSVGDWERGIDVAFHSVNHDRRAVPEGASLPTHLRVSSGIVTDPLGLVAARDFYMQHRLDRLPHGHDPPKHWDVSYEETETDRSEKLLIIDGFAFSPSYYLRHSQRTRALASLQRKDVLSAPDAKDERVIAFRRSMVTLYQERHSLLSQHAAAGSGYDDFVEALYHALSSTSSSDLGSTVAVDVELAMTCVNAGYLATYKTYNPSGTCSAVPLPHVADSFDLQKHFYPSHGPQTRHTAMDRHAKGSLGQREEEKVRHLGNGMDVSSQWTGDTEL